jgi:hypothetical protein
MQQILDNHAAQIGVCVPGKVTRYNRLKQTVEVEILTKKSDGSERSIVPNAPVIFPGVYWDIQVGETGILIIADEDWRTWWRTGEKAEPESVATHELSSAFFVPGLRSSPDSRTIPASATVLEKPTIGGTVRLGDQGATERVVLGDSFVSDLQTHLSDLGTWAQAVEAALAALGGSTGGATATFVAQLLAFALAAGNDLSQTVKVDS